VLRDVVDRVAHRGDLVGVGVGDLDGKLLLEGHDELDDVERVEAQVLLEVCGGGDLLLRCCWAFSVGWWGANAKRGVSGGVGASASAVRARARRRRRALPKGWLGWARGAWVTTLATDVVQRPLDRVDDAAAAGGRKADDA
jgi:hypothetical protein